MGARPNILHFFVDQQRFDTIHALGNPVIKTPNLDRLCARGVAFTSAYSPSPVCISARCSMIHGQYPMHTGCYANTRMPTDGRQTFMAALTEAGYRTHGIGKCHFNPDSYGLRGFQSRERQEEGGTSLDDLERNPYLKLLAAEGYDYLMEPNGVRGEMYYIPQPSQLPAKHHPTQWIGDRSAAFVAEQAGNAQPWYLFSSFIHPHPPFAPPNPWHKLYRAPLMPLPNRPPDFETLQTYVNRCQNRYKYRDQGIDRNLLRNIKAYYYACISFVDHQIGRILDVLEQTGQIESTLILFTGDHGEHLGDYDCFGKRSMHDSCARIPMIAALPGRLDGGRICDAPVSLVDLAPTFLAAAGAAVHTHPLDGADLAEIASGTCDRKRVFAQHAYTHHVDIVNRDRCVRPEYAENPALEVAAFSSYMAVSRDWKYIFSAPDDREFLFDRNADPRETRNMAGLPFCRQPLTDAREALFEFLRSGGEVSGIDGDRWRSFPKPEFPEDPDTGLLIQDGYTPWTSPRIPGYTD
ncbi:MAG: sulfatase-like hydrolase/transferase [Kiritimatiellaeota bacterium]|nr:sulfatase-like hydrolase/transferase [Kiritimatiellota bacterium]